MSYISQETLQQALQIILDRLDYGLITDNAKRLKVVPEQATAANLLATISIASAQTLATVTTVSTVTNQARSGDLQVQRVNEAIMDTAYNLGILNNISF